MVPLAVGSLAVAITIGIQALAVRGTVSFIRRSQRLGRVGTSFWEDMGIVALVIAIALGAHLLEIAAWAALFIRCGEFPVFGTAFYHSAVNFTTLGYGDLIMTPAWKLLGPLEAADGMLMFGVSTAMVFGVIQWLIQARFADLKA